MILECGLLSDAQKRDAAEVAARAGAAFVKTSTGFLGSGATIHDVTLLDQAVGARLAVKATGGIRFFEDAVALLEAVLLASAPVGPRPSLPPALIVRVRDEPATTGDRNDRRQR